MRLVIDASDQHLRSSAMRDHMHAGFRLLKTLPLLAGVGYVRISDYLISQAEGLPPLQFDQARSFLCSYRHLKSANREGSNWDALCSEVRATGSLGDKPLTVISAGEGAKSGADELQKELAGLSSRGRRVVVQGADHVTLVTHREHAHRVAEEIRGLFSMTGSSATKRRPEPDFTVTANRVL